MRIALCQLNPVMGDIAGNTQQIADALEATAADKPDLLVFPELFLQGYPPRDLLENRWFIDRSRQAVDTLRSLTRRYGGRGVIVGVALPNERRFGKGLGNAALLVADGEIIVRQDKALLPSYDVFDEARYFDPADAVEMVTFKSWRLGISICEDAWSSYALRPQRLYGIDPVAAAVSQGADILINIAASPYHVGKQRLRFSLMQEHALRHGKPFIFVNQVGGNDELIFDGMSLLFDAQGRLQACLPAFEEAIRVVDTAGCGAGPPQPALDTIASVHDALVLGIRDYLRKCGFTGAIVGLSGGIDSAVTCALAVAALGPSHVMGVTMPSRYSSKGSIADSKQLAANLGIEFREISIEHAFTVLLETMAMHFAGAPPDLTEENMQARIRGLILMALANKTGRILLSTGNKSEIAVGYCTLYGDMNGGLSVISDLPKSTVYQLAHYINREREIIPQASIEKPPSAELRPNQMDRDTLPPYEVLDPILQLLIEECRSRDEIVKEGFDPATVDWVIKAVKRSEYKRRQAALGLKVTPKAFGSGRRFPIAANYEI